MTEEIESITGRNKGVPPIPHQLRLGIEECKGASKKTEGKRWDPRPPSTSCGISAKMKIRGGRIGKKKSKKDLSGGERGKKGTCIQ